MGTVLTHIRPVGYETPFPQPVNVRFAEGVLREVTCDPISPEPNDIVVDGCGAFRVSGVRQRPHASSDGAVSRV